MATITAVGMDVELTGADAELTGADAGTVYEGGGCHGAIGSFTPPDPDVAGGVGGRAVIGTDVETETG
jgi:hypothetical protein